MNQRPIYLMPLLALLTSLNSCGPSTRTIAVSTPTQTEPPPIPSPAPSPTLPSGLVDLSQATPETQTQVPQLQIITVENVSNLEVIEEAGAGVATDIGWSDDGRFLALATENGVRILDPDTLDTFATLGLDNAQAVLFRPTGHEVAVVWYDTTRLPRITIANSDTRRGVLDIPTNGAYVLDLAFNPQGDLLAYVSSSGLYVHDARNGALVFSADLGSAVAVQFAQDSQLVLALTRDGGLTAFDIDGQLQVLDLDLGGDFALTLDVSPNGMSIAVGDAAGTVFTIDLDSREVSTLQPPHSARVLDLAWNSTGTLLATASADGTTGIWDTISRRRIALLEPGYRAVIGIAFSPNDHLIATASTSGAIQVWRLPGGEVLTSRVGALTVPFARAFSPEGRHIATGDAFGLVTVWDVQSRVLQWAFDDQSSPISSLAFSPDGRYLASATEAKVYENPRYISVQGKPLDQVVVWDLRTGETVFSSPAYFWGVAFTPDGAALVACANSTQRGLSAIGVADWEGSPYPYSVRRHTCRPSMAFSPDGTRLATVHGLETFPGEYQALVYDANLDGGDFGDPVAYSPDGKLVAHAGRGLVRVCYSKGTPTYDAAPKCLGRQMAFTLKQEASFIAFSPDSQLLLVGNPDDATLYLYATSNGEEVAAFTIGRRLFQYSAPAAWFDPSATTLVVLRWDGVLQVWALPSN